jgi:nitrogen fixation protein FixH
LKAARLWPLALGAVLALTVIANIWLLWAANDDQHLAFEPDYYRKAVAWDSTVARGERSRALGWTAAVALGNDGHLTVQLADAAGNPVDSVLVAVEVIPVAHANRAETASLQTASPGRAEADIRLVYPGLHELRVTALRGQDRFTTTVRGWPGQPFAP